MYWFGVAVLGEVCWEDRRCEVDGLGRVGFGLAEADENASTLAKDIVAHGHVGNFLFEQ